MTGADVGAGPGVMPGWRWDVALSFAGAQRDYVEQVAEVLKARGVRCFYDADEQIELWGKYLAEELPTIYGEQAAAVVVFVSAEYAARDWTRLERRAALAQAVRERREYVLPARFDDTPVPGLLSDMVTVDLRGRTPQHFAAMIAAKLASLGIGPSSSPGEAGRGPPGGIPVSEADPRRLGVHAAISVPGMSNEVPPEYVPRDADAAEFGVRARVATAAERGGFVLLVGASSVGKTRCAAEALKALLPDWWLVHPAGPDQVAALARVLSPRTVVWLDELQDYLDGEHGLDGAVIRALLSHPAVIIGTLWPEQYAAYTTVPAPGGADPRRRERQVLDLAEVVRIAPAFSPAEQDRARAAAVRDPRLRVALEATGYGLTQTLAAAPQLVARWQDAQTADPYAWAVLTAALDAARLGARAPLSSDFLHVAAPGYCTSQQQAEAPGNWFEQALTYAAGKLHGAAAALAPAAVGMGQTTGYTAADYLLQHASRERRSARVPASTWDAALSHIRDPIDAVRLADSARHRLLYRYAIPLYRHAADAGDAGAAFRLARLLADCGDLDGAMQALRTRATADKGVTLGELIDLLEERGNLDGLRARADAGDGHAAARLVRMLADRGDADGLRHLAVAGHPRAASELARMLANRGDLDGAVQVLRTRANRGDTHAALRLATLLANRGDFDGALQARRILAHSDNLRTSSLVALLPTDHDAGALRARADVGDTRAASELADLLADRGDADGLRELADAGNRNASDLLADLLADRNDADGLRDLAVAGQGNVAWRLADLIAKQGRGEEAEQLRRFGLNPDGSIACS